MPIYRKLNSQFFKKWTPKMAYILGFFTADGSMIKNKRGAHFIEFYIKDKNLLEKIRGSLGSNHKIKTRKRNGRTAYRLQIGSKEIFNDLLKLDLQPHKAKRISLPGVPKEYFSHFVRGYFDGDGCINFGFYQKKGRKRLSSILITRFTSSNRNFLKNLSKFLKKYTKIKGGCVYQKQEGGYDLSFSVRDSFKLCEFMYKDAKEGQFLKRKYNKFQEAIKYYAGVA